MLKGICLGMVLCVLASWQVQAQSPASAPPPVQPPASVTDDVYKLQPEDLLRVLVYNEQQASADVPVGKDGYISAPFVGLIKVAGKTTAQVESELVELYKAKLRIRDPRVSVTIIRYRTLKATVGGFVSRPGQFEIRPGDTLITLLNQGGGPIPDRADLRKATFRRANSNELIPVNLYDMLIKGDTSQNYKLLDGDELNIPEETNLRISVQGAVAQPGTYAYKEPMMLSDAISLARGEIRTRSMFSKVLIIREQKGQPGQFMRIQANYVRFIKNGDNSQNIALVPGDLIVVPETKTPDLQQITSIIQTFFYGQQFLKTGLFGFKL